MIKVFGQTDKLFSSNGDMVIKPLKAKVKKEDNGDFFLDLETGLEYADYLAEGNIIVANTPQGDQAFRITNPTKTKSKITVKAWHVFYDSENYLIADSYVVNKNCNDALDHLNSATDNPSPFSTLSDVITVNSFRCVRKSLYEAIQTVIERWGGHLVRDNFNIEIRQQIGQDNGVTVQYKKNLKEITCEENWDNVVTKLLPVGKDGLLLDTVDPTASLYVYSSTQYVIPYTKTVSFSQDDVLEEDYQDADGNLDEAAYTQALVDDLRVKAQEYVDLNGVPQVNYTLKANLERITDVGDTIEVIDHRLGIDLLTNLISYEYDCILKKYTELEFGNFKKTLSGLVSNITNDVDKQVSESLENVTITLNGDIQQATSEIWSVLGASNVIYDGDKILVVDTLPKEDATNVLMINSGGIWFSDGGISGTFKKAWSIDDTMDMSQINVVNLVADLIKGGTLKIGGFNGHHGEIDIFNTQNALIAKIGQNGITVHGSDGSYILMNADVGFAGYDMNDDPLFWTGDGEFHMKKSVFEEEVTLFNKLRFVPITIDSGGTVVNDGVGLLSMGG